MIITLRHSGLSQRVQPKRPGNRSLHSKGGRRDTTKAEDRNTRVQHTVPGAVAAQRIGRIRGHRRSSNHSQGHQRLRR